VFGFPANGAIKRHGADDNGRNATFIDPAAVFVAKDNPVGGGAPIVPLDDNGWRATPPVVDACFDLNRLSGNHEEQRNIPLCSRDGFIYVKASGPVSCWRPQPSGSLFCTSTHLKIKWITIETKCSLVGQVKKVFLSLVGEGPQLMEAHGPWTLWPMFKSGPVM
jgi:hypothetical protein